MGKGRDGLQRSEAGSQMSGDERTGGIDFLANRIAEVVRVEVNGVFLRGRGLNWIRCPVS